MHSLKRYVAKMTVEINKSIKYYDKISNKANNRALTKLKRMFDPNDVIRRTKNNNKKRNIINNMRAFIKGDMKK